MIFAQAKGESETLDPVTLHITVNPQPVHQSVDDLTRELIAKVINRT
jgi:hypothetical protein